MIEEGSRMRIIALQGKHNCGKTATLKKLIEMVHTGNLTHFTYEGVHPKGDVLELCRKEKGDKQFDMQYWCSCDGVKIGITTRGDKEELLYADFWGKQRNFSDRDIVVCATRSDDATVNFVIDHFTDSLIIRKKQLAAKNACDSHIAKVNTNDAEKILADMKRFVEEMREEK